MRCCNRLLEGNADEILAAIEATCSKCSCRALIHVDSQAVVGTSWPVFPLQEWHCRDNRLTDFPKAKKTLFGGALTPTEQIVNSLSTHSEALLSTSKAHLHCGICQSILDLGWEYSTGETTFSFRSAPYSTFATVQSMSLLTVAVSEKKRKLRRS